MKVTYVGSHTAGIYLPGDVFVAHGETVEVDKALGDELLGRSYAGKPEWSAAKPAPKTPDKET